MINTLKVGKYLEQGVQKKPGGFGDRAKVSTSTCQVCLQDPKLYNQVYRKSYLYDQALISDLLHEESLSFASVMFEDIKQFSFSPMHMTMQYSLKTFYA